MTLQALNDLDETTRDKLLEYRAQIDEIDNNIIDLLIKRSGIVRQVGKLKKQSYNPSCYIRPAREAEMLRDISARFTATGFSPAAAAAIWRIIIAASTSIESQMVFSTLAANNEPDFYWITREYFGGFSPVNRHTNPKLVISDLLEDKATVGILPMPSSGEEGNWWQLLLESASPSLQIFACLPFVINPYDPPAVAIAKIRPEPTDYDYTLIALKADEGISQHRLSEFFSGHDTDVKWIDITAPQAGIRLHLLRVKGFITTDHPLITALTAGSSLAGVTPILLGSYAAPLYISTNNQQPEKMEDENDSTNHATE